MSKKYKLIITYIMYLTIFIIACYDAWWCLQIPQDQFIYTEEQNPVVISLIKLFGVQSFIIIKIICCALVILICEVLRKIHTRVWKMVVISLLIFQLLVLFYLEFGHLIGIIYDSTNNTYGEILWKLYRAVLRNY